MYRQQKHLAAAAAAALLTISALPPADAAAGDWQARVGATMVDPDSSSDRVSALGSEVGVKDDSQLSFTIARFLTDRLAVELLGALPFKHDITAAGSTIGSTKHLPPTVSLQYYFMPQARVRPYVGAGINYTTFFDEKTRVPGVNLSIDDSWGLAGQAGVDVDLGPSWFINADVRYIDISTTAELSGAVNERFDVDIDPWVYTFAVGWRF